MKKEAKRQERAHSNDLERKRERERGSQRVGKLSKKVVESISTREKEDHTPQFVQNERTTKTKIRATTTTTTAAAADKLIAIRAICRFVQL